MVLSDRSRKKRRNEIKKPMFKDGQFMGYAVFEKKGIFNKPKFTGYEWKKN